MIDEPAIRGNSVEPVLSCLLRLPRSFKPKPPPPPSTTFARRLSISLFRFPAPRSANFITVSAEQICEIPNCYRSALESTLQVSVLLFTPEETPKLRDSIKWKLISMI